MNQRQAGNVLRRNAPQGEHPAFINQQEASWLKGMGGSGRPTKSGLRSYALPSSVTGLSKDSGAEANPPLNLPDANPLNAYDDPNTPSGGEVPPVPVLPTPDLGGGGSIPNPLAGGGMETRNNTSSSISEIDKPTHDFRKRVYGAAGDVMDTPYTKYGGKRFADPSKDTTDAHTGVREMQGVGQTEYGDASDVGSEVSKYASDKVGDQSFLSGKGVGEYMNPHTANVIGGLQDNAMKAMQMGRNQLGANAQMAGAGMGSRSAIEKGVMAGEVMSGLNQQTAELLNQSYRDATGMKKYDMDSDRDADKYNVASGHKDQDIRLRGAEGMVRATDAGRKAGYEDTTMLSRVGADVEGRDQREKDFEYDEYLEGRDWDKNNTMFASNVLSGAPVGTTTTNNNPMYRNRGGGRLGRALVGAGSGWLATGGNPYGALAGGAMGFMGDDMGGLG
jgi:hypothetical protein